MLTFYSSTHIYANFDTFHFICVGSMVLEAQNIWNDDKICFDNTGFEGGGG
jgi:hypothetical protein